jgi:hypothetical protein
VAHWKPDADFGSNGVALNHVAATTTPLLMPGYNDGAAQLRWQNPPGVATRLHASGGKLQTDSFGFSFWFNPRFLAPFENLIAREMPSTRRCAYARLSRQVLISGGRRLGRGPAGVGRPRQQSRTRRFFRQRDFSTARSAAHGLGRNGFMSRAPPNDVRRGSDFNQRILEKWA